MYLQAKAQAAEIQLAQVTEELAKVKLHQHELQKRLTLAEFQNQPTFQVSVSCAAAACRLLTGFIFPQTLIVLANCHSYNHTVLTAAKES